MQEVTTRAETLVPVQEEASVNVKKVSGEKKSQPSHPQFLLSANWRTEGHSLRKVAALVALMRT